LRRAPAGTGDGLRVTPGPLEDDVDVLAARFLRTDRFVVDGRAGSAPSSHIRSAPARVGEELVVAGWTVGVGQRADPHGMSDIDRDREVVASGRAVWVAKRNQPAGLVAAAAS
jgi:hypothetical protein